MTKSRQRLEVAGNARALYGAQQLFNGEIEHITPIIVAVMFLVILSQWRHLPPLVVAWLICFQQNVLLMHSGLVESSAVEARRGARPVAGLE